MTGLILPKPFQKILVVGHLHSKVEKLLLLEDISHQYDWIIFNGGICSTNYSDNQILSHIHKMKDFIKKHNSVYIIGRNDYLLLTITQNEEIKTWIRNSYNIVFADFITRGVVITDGGIPLSITNRSKLFHNLETSFVSKLGAKPWQESYQGNFGYIISNNPLTNKFPMFYRNSLQMGNYPENSVYAVEIDEIGIKKTYEL